MLRCVWQIIHLHVNFCSAQECLKSLLTVQKLSLALHCEFFICLLVYQCQTQKFYDCVCVSNWEENCGSKIGKQIPQRFNTWVLHTPCRSDLQVFISAMGPGNCKSEKKEKGWQCSSSQLLLGSQKFSSNNCQVVLMGKNQKLTSQMALDMLTMLKGYKGQSWERFT